MRHGSCQTVHDCVQILQWRSKKFTDSLHAETNTQNIFLLMEFHQELRHYSCL